MKRAPLLAMLAGTVLLVSAASTGRTDGAFYGALAIDQAAGDQWGWAVDYPTQWEADQRALYECGDGCSVVLRFTECGAYAGAADGAYGWAYGSDANYVQARALDECNRRTGEYCTVRVWGCNSRY